jgi:hypothetical protein
MLQGAAATHEWLEQVRPRPRLLLSQSARSKPLCFSPKRYRKVWSQSCCSRPTILAFAIGSSNSIDWTHATVKNKRRWSCRGVRGKHLRSRSHGIRAKNNRHIRGLLAVPPIPTEAINAANVSSKSGLAAAAYHHRDLLVGAPSERHSISLGRSARNGVRRAEA